MNRINPDVDIIMQILDAVAAAKPGSEFIASLKKQYIERGGLSKKQLEGLLGHAQKIQELPPARLATLEAIIKKKNAKHRSEATLSAAPEQKDPAIMKVLERILGRFPQHKRVVYFYEKYNKSSFLTPAEMDELRRFEKILLKQSE